MMSLVAVHGVICVVSKSRSKVTRNGHYGKMAQFTIGMLGKKYSLLPIFKKLVTFQRW